MLNLHSISEWITVEFIYQICTFSTTNTERFPNIRISQSGALENTADMQNFTTWFLCIHYKIYKIDKISTTTVFAKKVHRWEVSHSVGSKASSVVCALRLQVVGMWFIYSLKKVWANFWNVENSITLHSSECFDLFEQLFCLITSWLHSESLSVLITWTFECRFR